MRAYVVIDVGCMCCGVIDEVVGCYLDRSDADAARAARNDQTNGWRDGGNTGAKVFEIEVGPLPSLPAGVALKPWVIVPEVTS